MKHLLAALGVLIAVDGAIAPAEGQSLADVARREAERRQAVGVPGRLYTNKDLARTATLATERPILSRPGTPNGPAPTDAAPQGNMNDPVLSDKALEERWRLRADTQREAIARAEIVAAALGSRINALTTDSVNRDDPAQRAVLLADRDAAARELERVQQEIVAGNAALAAMLEEARRAGVPPGWVRERGR